MNSIEALVSRMAVLHSSWNYPPFGGLSADQHEAAGNIAEMMNSRLLGTESTTRKIGSGLALFTVEDPFTGTSRSSSPNVQPMAPQADVLDALVVEAPSLTAVVKATPRFADPHDQALNSHQLDMPSVFLGPPAATTAAAAAEQPHMAANAATSSSSSAFCPHSAQKQQQAPSSFPASPTSAINPKEWLYQLVTCSYLFKPCPDCCHSHSGREVLITYFDTDNPSHGYCTYCPGRASRPHLLQIRRSTYHEVIKAGDIAKSTDTSGVQHYVINGSKVLFLRPRPQPRPPKGVVAPARCMVDGRQLMDHSSCYCSLRCKLEVEDGVFKRRFPHDVLEAADREAEAAARAAVVDKNGGRLEQLPRARATGGVAVVAGKRAAAAGADGEAGRGLSTSAGSMDDANHTDQGMRWGVRSKRQRTVPSKYASMDLPHKPAAPGSAAADAGTHSQEDGRVSGQVLVLGSEHGNRERVRVRDVASPCNSADSERSTTCNFRWHHKRKGEPIRSPLQ